jgi:methionyl aminopeptidase
MRRAGLVVADALDAVREAARPGVSGLELDEVAESVIRAQGAVPSLKGYFGYPGSICLSVNETVIHGIPDERVLHRGDIVSVDCGAVLDGWHGDSAITFPIGPVSDTAARLMAATEAGLWAGIRAMALGHHVGDIGRAVTAEVGRHDPKFGVVRDYVGHGIGQAMHLDPDVPNFPTRRPGPRLVPWCTLAIEPMIVEGSIDLDPQPDGWTVLTADRGLAAHFEHTVVRTTDGVWALTARDGGAAMLRELGLPEPPNPAL